MNDSEKLALVENMLLLRKEDFDELLDRAADRPVFSSIHPFALPIQHLHSWDVATTD